jgi:hypothetical protein
MIIHILLYISKEYSWCMLASYPKAPARRIIERTTVQHTRGGGGGGAAAAAAAAAEQRRL